MHNREHSRKKNIKFVALLNISFTLIELIGGLLTNSLAILSDALHDLGDSVALSTAWYAEHKAKAPPDEKRTFGYQRLSLFGALFSATVLLAGSLFILSEAVQRLLSPEPVNSIGMIWLAVIGIVFNSIGMFRLKRGESMSEKVLSWHLLEDVFGWIVVLVGAIVIYFTDYYLIDPVITIFYTLFILWGVVRNLREVYNILMQGVPDHIDVLKIKGAMLALPGIKSIHDVHVWSLEGETDVFTGHVVVEDSLPPDAEALKAKIKATLAQHHIEHSTIELESERECASADCGHRDNL